jgi:hypothetical protein
MNIDNAKQILFKHGATGQILVGQRAKRINWRVKKGNRRANSAIEKKKIIGQHLELVAEEL